MCCFGPAGRPAAERPRQVKARAQRDPQGLALTPWQDAVLPIGYWRSEILASWQKRSVSGIVSSRPK